MMKPLVVSLLLATPLACSSADARLERAMASAYDLIGAEASSPFCKPASITQEQRDAVVLTLSPIKKPSLSDATGLTPLDYAVLADDVPSITRFLALGYALDSRDIHGGTPLHGAALLGSRRALDFLLASGADPNVANSNGATPLMVAVSENRVDIARALLKAGASATSRTTQGATVLHYALPCRDEPLLRLLLAAGAVPDDKALSLAAKFGVDLAPTER